MRLLETRRTLFSLLILVLIINQGKAQQQAAFSLYNQFEGIYNPSAVPSEYSKHEHNLIIGADARTQWTRLSSAPKTQFLKAEYITDFDNTFNLIMGGYVVNDKAGPVSTTGVYFRLASIMSNYDPTLGGISAGLQLGAIQYRIDAASLHTKYPTDLLTTNNVQATKPQLSLGISYYNSFERGLFDNTQLNTGISITHLGFNKQVFKDGIDEFDINTNRHYYAYAKIRKTLFGEQAVELNTWIRYVENMPVNFDAHFVFDINDIFSVELGTNSSGIAHGGVGFNIYDIFRASNSIMHISYSYNPSFLKTASFFGSTHEMNVNYSFKR